MDLLEQPERAQALTKEAQARLARQPDILQGYLDAVAHPSSSTHWLSLIELA